MTPQGDEPCGIVRRGEAGVNTAPGAEGHDRPPLRPAPGPGIVHTGCLTAEAIVNGYNFTERVRRALMTAREEAFALRHEYVGTEHVLLGLISDGEGVAAAVIQNANLDPREIRDRVLETVRPGTSGPHGPDLPYTSRAKKVLELSMSVARTMSHSYVGTEHILIGLIEEEKGIAAQVLKSFGLTAPAVRAEVLRLLGTEAPLAQRKTVAPDREARITVVVEHPDGRLEALKFVKPSEAVRYLASLEL